MGLKIYLDHGDGKAYQLLAEIGDRRVTRVSLNGATGEAGALNVTPDQAEVVLRYDSVIQDGRPNLIDLESMQNRTLTGDEVQERVDALNELPSAQNQGGDVLFEASQQREAVLQEQERVEAVRVENEAERLRQLDQVQGLQVSEVFTDQDSSAADEEVDPSGGGGESGHSEAAETGSTVTHSHPFNIGTTPSEPAGVETPATPAVDTTPTSDSTAGSGEADLAAQRLKESEA